MKHLFKSILSTQPARRLIVSTFLAISLAILFSALSLKDHAAKRDMPRPDGDPALAARTRVAEAYGKLPMLFQANAGQTDARVKFTARGPGYSLFLTQTESVFVMSRRSEGESKESRGNESNSEKDLRPLRPAEQAVLRMKLVGANPEAALTGVDEMPTKVSYFAGSDPSKWHAALPAFGRVRYEKIYPGVDQVFYGNQGQLEYDLIVAPQADYRQIKLKFEGAKQIRLDEASGDLILVTRDGVSVRQHKPIAYQEIAGERRAVEGGYEMLSGREGEVGFRIGRYDASNPLVIDPTLVYSTYLGGTGAAGGENVGGDQASGIAVDATGNAYVIGRTDSPDFPTTPGAYETTYGSECTFISKLNASGSALVYSTYLSHSRPSAITVDTAGNAYVAGVAAENFPTTPGAYQTTYSSHGINGANAFVTKLNPSGSALTYSTYLGGSGNDGFMGFTGGDGASGIAVDPAGNAYVEGATYSRDFPTTPGAFQTVNRANNPVKQTSLFVSKFNPSGSALVYSTYLGGTQFEDSGEIAVDVTGNAYVTGTTPSEDFPTTPGAYRTTYPGFGSVVVTKLNPSGTGLIFSTYLGGTDAGSRARGLALDGTGNTYIAGQTFAATFPTTAGSFRRTYCGGYSDAFVTKLNSTGTALVYSTYLCAPDLLNPPPTDDTDDAFGVAVDSAGNAVVTGYTNSRVFPVTPGAHQLNLAGKDDAFLAKLNANGSALLYSTYLGSSEYDDVYGGVAVDAADKVYLAGSTNSFDFPITAGSFQPLYAGGNDVFVAKFDTSFAPGTSTVQFAQSSSPTDNSACASVNVTVTRTGDLLQPASVDYQTRDIVAAQRSDYTFASGTVVFAAGETSKTFPVLITKVSRNVGFPPGGTKSATVVLTNPQNAALGSQGSTQLVITDLQITPTNPIDEAATFVGQHYHDFLDREPDPSGLQFWTNEITSCTGDVTCIDIKRQNVSAAYFLSREFQETGFYVIRMQRAAFGRRSSDPAKRIPYPQFLLDAQRVGLGFVDLQPGGDLILEQNKVAYAQTVAGSPAFIARFPVTQTAAQFVDALYQMAGVTPTAQELQDAVAVFGAGDTAGRAASLRKVSESTSLKNAEFAPAFVLSEYFGYLRRNPTDAPDYNDDGYQFWLNKLNEFGGNFITSEMIKAFILSAEYRHRFGNS